LKLPEVPLYLFRRAQNQLIASLDSGNSNNTRGQGKDARGRRDRRIDPGARKGLDRAEDYAIFIQVNEIDWEMHACCG
jgi:hypothetical protein